jgi:hypothetical protein
MATVRAAVTFDRAVGIHAKSEWGVRELQE